MTPNPIKPEQMTNEPEMTLDLATNLLEDHKIAMKELRSIIPGNPECQCQQCATMQYFLAGHAAASKEAEVYREALEKILKVGTSKWKGIDEYHLDFAATIAKEALPKGRTT